MRKIIFQVVLLVYAQLTVAQNFTADASIWESPWMSCSTSENPNSRRGNSHWIMYDLGLVRNLSKSWIWNVNDPQNLNTGFRTVAVDYSNDGTNWTQQTQMTFPRGTGSAVYSGFAGPDLYGVSARFVLFTVIDTYGDGSCAGIAEVKFNLSPVIQTPIADTTNVVNEGTAQTTVLSTNKDEIKKSLVLYPNPVTDDQLKIVSNYSGEATVAIYAIGGQLMLYEEIDTAPNQPVTLNISKIPRGLFLVKVINREFESNHKVLIR